MGSGGMGGEVTAGGGGRCFLVYFRLAGFCCSFTTRERNTRNVAEMQKKPWTLFHWANRTSDSPAVPAWPRLQPGRFLRTQLEPPPWRAALVWEGWALPELQRREISGVYDVEIRRETKCLSVQHFSRLPFGLQGVSSQFFFLFILALLAWSSSSDSRDGYTLRRKKKKDCYK